ncbi:hypothetical protein [Wenyingzhuangia sp. 2_MG-2023]|uniref:hypothetical protein n=1 Tax=Wenyingzhuangia sp. 2_MG-2023 TaxID=3062639 RepID=UPI0026E2E5FA|nr:hypothetical protein [Wenyingzhuangia sp. 2_MG-2023]MDO6739349.1 hypothetical protein [Wenyingzhuangia sp. 2_MG-2023]
MDLAIAIVIFIVSFLLVLLLRKKIGKEYEIKNTDILIGIIPLALWLLLTGKITNFEYGDLKITSAFTQAKNKPITGTITDIYKSNLPSAEKGSIYELERTLESKPEALIFYSGQKRYASEVIEEYLKALSTSTLKYLIIKNTADDFVGMVSVDQFMSQTLSEDPIIEPYQFAQWLNNGEDDQYSLIKGFITLEQSLPETITKIEALEQMEKLKTKFLPVVAERSFVGIIERDQLSTSLLMDISKNINEK